MIYEYALTFEHPLHSVCNHEAGEPCEPSVGSLLAVNKNMYNETRGIFYSNNIFRFHLDHLYVGIHFRPSQAVRPFQKIEIMCDGLDKVDFIRLQAAVNELCSSPRWSLKTINCTVNRDVMVKLLRSKTTVRVVAPGKVDCIPTSPHPATVTCEVRALTLVWESLAAPPPDHPHLQAARLPASAPSQIRTLAAKYPKLVSGIRRSLASQYASRKVQGLPKMSYAEQAAQMPKSESELCGLNQYCLCKSMWKS